MLTCDLFMSTFNITISINMRDVSITCNEITVLHVDLVICCVDINTKYSYIVC